MGEELWYVKLANGDVHRVTIDQLDGAFQAGHIDESTMVLAAGASQWTKLGDLAGLGDDESEAPDQPPVDIYAAAGEPPQDDDDFSYVPRHDDGEVLDYVPQVQSRAPQQAAYVPQVQAAPAAVTADGYIPQIAPPRGARPAAQVQQRAAAPVAYAPPANATPYSVAVSMRPAPAPYVPSSLRPMSMDLSDDLDMPVPRKGRAGRFAAAVVVLAGIAGGIGFEAQRAHIGIAGFGGSSSSDLSNVAAAAAVAPPPPVAEPVVTPPPAPAPPPVTTPSPTPAANGAPVEASPMNPSFTSRLNEATTKKLLSADKARETKAKARHSGGGGGGGVSSHTKSSAFTTGGNKFDPLNSSI